MGRITTIRLGMGVWCVYCTYSVRGMCVCGYVLLNALHWCICCMQHRNATHTSPSSCIQPPPLLQQALEALLSAAASAATQLQEEQTTQQQPSPPLPPMRPSLLKNDVLAHAPVHQRADMVQVCGCGCMFFAMYISSIHCSCQLRVCCHTMEHLCGIHTAHAAHPVTSTYTAHPVNEP